MNVFKKIEGETIVNDFNEEPTAQCLRFLHSGNCALKLLCESQVAVVVIPPFVFKR